MVKGTVKSASVPERCLNTENSVIQYMFVK